MDLEQALVLLSSGLPEEKRMELMLQLLDEMLGCEEKQEIIQDPGTLSCKKCGACCLPDRPHLGELAWVVVLGPELDLMGSELEDFYTEPDHGKMLEELGLGTCEPIEELPGVGRLRLMRARTDVSGLVRCKALAGEPGVRCECAIYEDRPRICRSVEKGSLSCLAYRRQYRPLLNSRQEKFEV